MKNQEDNSQTSNTTDSLDTALNQKTVSNAKRRALSVLGVGAPVVLTLASRSVLAGQCLSNMLSGNLSDPNRGHCQKGCSPGGWGQPGGTIMGLADTTAWNYVNFTYGTCSTASKKWSDYSGGTTINHLEVSSLNIDGCPSYTTLREILNSPSSWQLTRHLVCAYLNAKLSTKIPSTFTYVLTVDQVYQLASGAILPPAGMDLNKFLDGTWT